MFMLVHFCQDHHTVYTPVLLPLLLLSLITSVAAVHLLMPSSLCQWPSLRPCHGPHDAPHDDGPHDGFA